jgi:tetratricopeptide (TPR) repeat protein
MMARRIWIAGLGALVLLALAAPPDAGAEVIRLRSGRILQGEIDPARTTDDAITVTLYRDGAVTRVLWDHVLGRDAKRLREALGLDVLEGDTFMWPAHELVLYAGGETMRGLVMGEDGANYQLKTAKGGRTPQAVPRSIVAKKLEIQLPLLEIYSVEEAYENKVVEIRSGRPEEEQLTADEHALIADYCYKLGAYAQAKEHYERALEDGAHPDVTRWKNKLKNLDVLVQAAEAGELFNEIRRLRVIERYRDALEVVKTFREKYGHLKQVLAIYRLDTVEKRLAISLREQRIQKVSSEWFRFMSRRISDTLRENKDWSLKDAQAFAQRDLTSLIVEDLTKKLDLEKEVVLDLWKQRKAKAKPHTATYGYGSFAAPAEVARAKEITKDARARLTPEEIRRRQLEALRRRRQQQAKKEEKPKTAEEWWDGATSQSRRNWLTAFYVEQGGAEFEILRTFYDECGTCAGKGYKVINVMQGDGGQEKERCLTCNGHGKVRMIRYK